MCGDVDGVVRVDDGIDVGGDGGVSVGVGIDGDVCDVVLLLMSVVLLPLVVVVVVVVIVGVVGVVVVVVVGITVISSVVVVVVGVSVVVMYGVVVVVVVMHTTIPTNSNIRSIHHITNTRSHINRRNAIHSS